ncbi:MAG: glycosyltransferase [Acidaminococcaceae bacterium]|nr:glycosyltransferase [Acidaminococcaceae bacterium]
MDLPLVSVVIPVFNVEEYLACCIESVLKQTYTNLEIILLDDGSTDRSGEICDEYAETQEFKLYINLIPG